MKFNRLGAFTLGVVITAVSVGAVSFVNAAGDATINACANKKTGSMRYLAKGSCKKTETLLSWNQMGPQGTPGATGAKGEAGSASSSTSVSTQSVTLRYLAATTSDSRFDGDSDCGSGTQTAYSPGYSYFGGEEFYSWYSVSLSTAQNWQRLKSCEITVNVVSP